MLDFAVKLTAEPWAIEEEDREALRQAGFTDRDIWDIAAVAGFYNMSQPRRLGHRHAAEQRVSRAGAVAMPIRLMENFRAVFYAPYYATHALGFYKREGVDVELLTSDAPGDAVPKLIDGTIDLTWGGPMRVMKAHDQDKHSPLVSFCEVVSHDPFFLIGASRAPFRLADLPASDLLRCPRCRRRGCACSRTCAIRASTRTSCPAFPTAR